MSALENFYKQVSDERYALIMGRCDQFVEAMDKEDQEPVKVFDPLSQHLIDELHLIREVSKDLQKKKEEDINKAAQAAKEEEAKPKEDEGAKEVPKEDA